MIILSDAFERDVTLADAKTRASFLFFFQNVRELGEHVTQNAEIRFGVVMHRRVRENEFARFGGGFLREAVGEEVLDVVLVVVHVVVSGNERREILFGGFESDGVGARRERDWSENRRDASESASATRVRVASENGARSLAGHARMGALIAPK